MAGTNHFIQILLVICGITQSEQMKLEKPRMILIDAYDFLETSNCSLPGNFGYVNPFLSDKVTCMRPYPKDEPSSVAPDILGSFCMLSFETLKEVCSLYKNGYQERNDANNIMEPVNLDEVCKVISSWVSSSKSFTSQTKDFYGKECTKYCLDPSASANSNTVSDGCKNVFIGRQVIMKLQGIPKGGSASNQHASMNGGEGEGVPQPAPAHQPILPKRVTKEYGGLKLARVTDSSNFGLQNSGSTVQNNPDSLNFTGSPQDISAKAANTDPTLAPMVPPYGGGSGNSQSLPGPTANAAVAAGYSNDSGLTAGAMVDRQPPLAPAPSNETLQQADETEKAVGGIAAGSQYSPIGNLTVVPGAALRRPEVSVSPAPVPQANGEMPRPQGQMRSSTSLPSVSPKPADQPAETGAGDVERPPVNQDSNPSLANQDLNPPPANQHVNPPSQNQDPDTSLIQPPEDPQEDPAPLGEMVDSDPDTAAAAHPDTAHAPAGEKPPQMEGELTDTAPEVKPAQAADANVAQETNMDVAKDQPPPPPNEDYGGLDYDDAGMDSFGKDKPNVPAHAVSDDIYMDREPPAVPAPGGSSIGAGGMSSMTLIRENADSNFFAYFLTAVVLCIILYLMFHNKQKIIALIIEGRNPGGRRRPYSNQYRKLDNSLEEAITTQQRKEITSNIIY